MATIKLKFMPSSVKDREGSLFYHIIHLREVRQIYTGLHLHKSEWDCTNSSVITKSASDTQRTIYLSSVNRSVKDGLAKLTSIISQLDGNASPYTARDVVKAYNAPMTVAGVVSYTGD